MADAPAPAAPKPQKAKKEKKAASKGEDAGPLEMQPPPSFLQDRLDLFDRLKARQDEEIAKKPREPIQITMPDGAVKEGTSWETTPGEIALAISKSLYKKTVVARLDGDDEKLWDLDRPLEASCKLELLDFNDPKGKMVFWHSSAHVLGEACERRFGCSLCIGPPIDSGFYYEMALPDGAAVQETDWKPLETIVSKVAKEKQKFERLVMTKEELLDMFKYNKYKQHIIKDKIPDGTSTTVYRNGPLIDLCRGPHVPDTGRIEAFSILKNSASYFLGNQENDSLQRVYGVSFPDKKLMAEHKKMLEEAAKRDHRKIGKDQELFFFDPVSPGAAFWLPHGARIYGSIQAYLKKEYRKRGYEEVITPNMFNADLWKQSGHWQHYKDDMFIQKIDDVDFGLKPMNCPSHFVMFGHRERSHRELPLRLADFGVLHRNEASGALSGLTRVRRFQQDDAHIFCRQDQIKQEMDSIFEFLQEFYRILGLKFKLHLSTRPEGFMGELETWDKAETSLKESLDEFTKKNDMKWELNPGDGAFYGPKIDIKVVDSLNREWQCATAQLDFVQPENGNQIEAEANSDDSDGDEASGLLEKLLEVLQNDPSADVRRSLLVNLPILPNTLPFLLERARDQDAMTRRAVYSRLLPALGDFRHLSLSMREKLLRWGLRDRDETVRKAAGRLFRERWIEDCAGAPPLNEDGQPAEAPAPSFDGLLELLERIDVVNSGVENGVALEAMRGFWEGRPDYREGVTFDDNFWETLSAESVFMARSFNDFCRNEGNGKYEDLVEEKLPEVTKLGFYLERYVKVLVDALKRVAQQEELGEEDDEEEDTVEQEFIVEQLLHIAMTLDYSDEVGRRKMFSLLRTTLSIPELPDEVTKLTVNVLRDICAPDNAGEREFCSVVLEAVADVHDTIVDEPNDDESFHSAKSEVDEDEERSGRHGKADKDDELTEEEAHAKAVKEIVINMKCLHIVQCMLTNVSGSLQENDHLVSMLNNLVVPAVRSHEAPVRERGLLCLGLCSLLDRSLAEENLTLFMHFFSKGHTALQITALHILTDILNVHGAQLLSNNPTLMRVYVKALRSGSKSPEIQAVATIAASKLLLGRVVTDPDASAEFLKTLVIAYFEPASSQNQSVRQALNYFLPVFCYSRPENQDLMRAVALEVLHALYNVREGLEDDDADVDDEMVSLATIGACLVDWTDPRKCYSPDAGTDTEKKNVNGDVHLEFARNILGRLDSSCSKEEKKVVAALLGKLYISPASTEDKIRELYAEVSEAVEMNLISDTTGRNALYKIHVSLGKIVNTLDQAKESGRRRSTMSRSVSLGPDEHVGAGAGAGPSARGATAEPRIKEEDEDEDEDDGLSRADDGGDDDSNEGTVIQNMDVTTKTEPGDGDSLVSELLDDDGDTVMG